MASSTQKDGVYFEQGAWAVYDNGLFVSDHDSKADAVEVADAVELYGLSVCNAKARKSTAKVLAE